MARQNENENENESTSGSRDGLFAGSLYNTYKIAKQAFVTAVGNVARAPQIPRFHEMGGWDAENKGWVYIAEFTKLKPDWFAELKAVAVDQGQWSGWDLSTPAGRTALDNALAEIVDAAGEREDRFAEILHQRDAEGCISYWMGMLGIESEKHPNTYQLIRVARKLGEMIVMCLKENFDAARPSQICPAIVPAFDPPRTASYPAGHALQSYLISYLLLRVMPKMEQMGQSNKPGTWEEQHNGLFALARRVADNRVIGGVHFDIDNKAGFFIAKKIDEWFDAWLPETDQNEFDVLVKAAKVEFPQWA